MKLNFRNMPAGSLPYDNIQPCKKMMLRLFEKLPFIPELSLINNDSIKNRTFSKLPFLSEKDGKLIFTEGLADVINRDLVPYEKLLNSNKLSDFEPFAQDSQFLEIFEAMLEKFEPEYAYFGLIGPFSFANMIFNRSASSILVDKTYRKFITLSVTLKALWFIYYVKSISPKTKPIIMFNENLLYKFGTLKRTNENITNDTVSLLFKKVFERLKKEDAVIGVQSFEKCNWQLVFDTNMVDIISIDAYNNSNNLNILANSIHKFLSNGGIINWGIVPVTNEKDIRTLNLDKLYTMLINAIEDLASQGVSADMLYKNLTVSVQGDLDKYPILFAEKALMMAEQISKKLPTSSGTIQHDD